MGWRVAACESEEADKKYWDVCFCRWKNNGACLLHGHAPLVQQFRSALYLVVIVLVIIVVVMIVVIMFAGLENTAQEQS